MDQKVAYLVHPGIDDPDIPIEGRKVTAARKWNTPIVGMREVREMARNAAEAQEEMIKQGDLARKTAKGKGKAILTDIVSSICEH